MKKYTQILILIAIIITVYGLYNCNCNKRMRYYEQFQSTTITPLSESIHDMGDLNNVDNINKIKKSLTDSVKKMENVSKNNQDLLKKNEDFNKFITDLNHTIRK